MINSLYKNIKYERGMEVPFAISMVTGLVAGIPAFIVACCCGYSITCIVIYLMGWIVSFITTSFIDYSSIVYGSDSESEARGQVIGLTFIWPGILLFAFIGSFVFIFRKMISVLVLLHKNIRSLKNMKLPMFEKKVPTPKPTEPEPVPLKDPYRTVPSCDSCGQTLKIEKDISNP